MKAAISLAIRAAAVLGLSALGCATSPPAAPPPPTRAEQPAAGPPDKPHGPASGLAFVVEPSDAEIFVNGASLGLVSDLSGKGGTVALEPGVYQVSLKRAGYVTWRAEVAVKSGTERIQVVLARGP
ncbi:MAG: PEGA domain-containing protein [Myxococcales bacterium]|nr:PEGA domain-containing protein [Myxococcales bacterium]